VLPVARDAAGSWQLRANSDGVKMAFLDAEQCMTGFVLTGRYAAERNEMSKQLGHPLPAGAEGPLHGAKV
jgi:hypothetical protein